MNNSIDIKDIIEHKRIQTHFQPIVSMKKSSIIGFEALSRSYVEGKEKFISPLELFSLAAENNLTVELDRLCRELSLKNFRKDPFTNKDMLLFLNFETSIIDRGVVGSGHLINMVNELQIDPGHIVIEINESRVINTDELIKFVKTYREYGFLIAIDDLGSGFSNLNRIPILKPDIIKIHRTMIENINKEYYISEVYNSLLSLSRKIGAIVIAEGVETDEELMKVIEFGTDMIQGYYFLKPAKLSNNGIKECIEKLTKASTRFKNSVVNKINKKVYFDQRYKMVIESFLNKVKNTNEEDLDNTLKELLTSDQNIECIYILDTSGIQQTNTILTGSNKKSGLFKPAMAGEDHSLKDYFLFVAAGAERFITDPYISMATGNLCITFAIAYVNIYHKKYILCIDIRPDFLF
ncbi:MAG: EAL domain-containing protein [Nitrospirae bacterium]|nr:EAL domain-containing protein [Nitrospirota bacterium]